jgi:hypothetical protein
VLRPLQVYERAAPFFELAARLQPHEPKWALMVASCHRRVGKRPQLPHRRLVDGSPLYSSALHIARLPPPPSLGD